MSSGGFSSSGSASNQAKEGKEDIGGSEFSTGGKHSIGMSSSGSTTNQVDIQTKKEDDLTKLYTETDALKTSAFQK
ncbi:hypothetical protein I4U23_027720 [Adineta vaga]|nr:hypothetical protein I4U23_027720 [Adineta vaga]